MKYILLGLAIVATGLFSIICSLKECSWFFNNYKAKRFVDAFGFRATKIIYVVIGLFLVGVGLVPIAMFLS